jgi:hypothetical protein
MLVIHFEPGILGRFGCAYRLDPHTNQSLATVFIRSNSEGDIPRRRRQFSSSAIEINGATMPVALAQSKYEMLFV